MDAEVKARWVTALRDTEKYRKVVGALHCESGFCCLGVLCDLYLQENGKQWVRNDIQDCDDNCCSFGFPKGKGYEYATLPYEVRVWAGLQGRVVSPHNPRVWGISLAEWNDDFDKSLPEIADLIEAYL